MPEQPSMAPAMTSAEEALKNLLLWRHTVLSDAQRLLAGLESDPDGLAVALFDGPLWDAASAAMACAKQPTKTQPALNDFPRLGINTRELVDEVNRLLVLAREEKDMGAVNWTDLHVADVEYRLSMLDAKAAPQCVVTVEEASPGCMLATWLNENLDENRFPNTWVECEW